MLGYPIFRFLYMIGSIIWFAAAVFALDFAITAVRELAKAPPVCP
jgi:hypothetical protein